VKNGVVKGKGELRLIPPATTLEGLDNLCTFFVSVFDIFVLPFFYVLFFFFFASFTKGIVFITFKKEPT